MQSVQRDHFERQHLHPMATLLLILGASFHPAPPRIIQSAFNSVPALRWSLVFTLIWQGGGARNISKSLFLTMATWMIYTLLTWAFSEASNSMHHQNDYNKKLQQTKNTNLNWKGIQPMNKVEISCHNDIVHFEINVRCRWRQIFE